MSLDDPCIFTRRGILFLAGTGLVSLGQLEATVSDFWNKKPPSRWDSEEIERLLHKSPWARSVNAQYAPGESPRNSGGYPGGGGGYPGGGGGYPGGGRGGIGIPGIGMPRGRRGGGMPRPGGSQASNEKGTVRWESAQVVLDATKSPLPEAFANHYVISVSGIPLRDRRGRSYDSDTSGRDDDRRQPSQQDDMLDDLKQFTTLTPKGKEVAQAGVVQRGNREYSLILFGFAKDFLNLSKKDKEVHFATRLGQLEVKAKFDLGEMKYRKELAV